MDDKINPATDPISISVSQRTKTQSWSIEDQKQIEFIQQGLVDQMQKSWEKTINNIRIESLRRKILIEKTIIPKISLNMVDAPVAQNFHFLGLYSLDFNLTPQI